MSVGELHPSLADHFTRLELGFLDHELGFPLGAALDIFGKRLSGHERIRERRLGPL